MNFTSTRVIGFILLVCFLAISVHAKVDIRVEVQRPPLQCYRCTSDLWGNDTTTFPFLPYHKNCRDWGFQNLPPSFLVTCDNTTNINETVTIYDSIGPAERKAYLSDILSHTGKLIMECGQIYSSENGVTRKGCAAVFSSFHQLFLQQKKIYKGEHSITANYCAGTKCNAGAKVGAINLVTLLIVGACSYFVVM